MTGGELFYQVLTSNSFYITCATSSYLLFFQFTGRMQSAINDLMFDMLAAIARKDYEDRRRRQKEGIVKAKSEGRYPGRPSDVALQLKIEGLLVDKKSYDYIQHILGCSRSTISKVSKRLKLGESKTD
jgi:DNA invertase Pin-like site-specific DNA recombinase